MPASIIIGLVAGFIGFFSVSVLKHRMGYDDSLDAFGVHGLCGIWGAMATGLFASPEVTSGVSGLFYGNPKQVGIQALSIVITAGFSGIGTLIVIYVTKLITGGIRVEKDDEVLGLDTAIHGERAFQLD